MDDATQSYYEDMINLFATDGWSRLIADFTETVAELDNLTNVNNTEQLYFRKGQVAVLNDVLVLEQRVRAALEELENPTTEEVDAAYL